MQYFRVFFNDFSVHMYMYCLFYIRNVLDENLNFGKQPKPHKHLLKFEEKNQKKQKNCVKILCKQYICMGCSV